MTDGKEGWESPPPGSEGVNDDAALTNEGEPIVTGDPDASMPGPSYPGNGGSGTGAVTNPINVALGQNQASIFHYQYPLNLLGLGEEPYVLIKVYESVYAQRYLGSIAMCLPDNLTNAHRIDYNPTPMLVEQGLALVRKWQNQSLGHITRDTLYSAAGKAVDQAIGGNSGEASAAKIVGHIINPHTAYMFTGVQYRRFTFSWDMYATSEKESEQIKYILQKVKYHAHPGVDKDDPAARNFLFPENFKIYVVSGGGGIASQGSILFKTSICSITDIRVTYNGEQGQAFFLRTGEPLKVSMALTFQEQEPVTKERVMEGY